MDSTVIVFAELFGGGSRPGQHFAWIQILRRQQGIDDLAHRAVPSEALRYHVRAVKHIA